MGSDTPAFSLFVTTSLRGTYGYKDTFIFGEHNPAIGWSAAEGIQARITGSACHFLLLVP